MITAFVVLLVLAVIGLAAFDGIRTMQDSAYEREVERRLRGRR
jgi:hypothetical protein